jgi:Domain of unknown function (DUF4430)
MRRIVLAASVLGLIAIGAAACSVAGSQKGAAQLLVTRDFGTQRMVAATEDPIESGETAMRILMRNARVKTRYGGRFVNAVNGISSASGGGRRRDWFYYVNGIEADVGAAEHKVTGGERVWWDYHDWTDVMRVPAVVGSFPEPFIHGSEGKRYPVRIDCGNDDRRACTDVADRLEGAGIAPSTSAIGAPAGKEVLRFVVGRWDEVRADAASEQIEEGPDKSGVFARFGPAGGGAYELDLLDPHGRVVRSLGPGAGLVAATRFEEQAPTWVVAGTDSAGLDHAISLLQERTLRSRFAVATTTGKPIAVPLGATG